LSLALFFSGARLRELLSSIHIISFGVLCCLEQEKSAGFFSLGRTNLANRSFFCSLFSAFVFRFTGSEKHTCGRCSELFLSPLWCFVFVEQAKKSPAVGFVRLEPFYP
jgi:hypothetical protein